MAIESHEPIENLYPAELANVFPTFAEELSAFVKRNHGKIANLSTSTSELDQYVKELQHLAILLAQGLRSTNIDEKTLYLLATAPSRMVGKVERSDPRQVGTLPGKHMYHLLDKEKAAPGNDFMLLNQRIPFGVDTRAEVHAVNKDQEGNLIPAKGGGIEIYIPLTNDISFYVNENVYQPQALTGLITIFPGDIHHHVKKLGQGPARVLIVSGFGFGKDAEKVEPKIPIVVKGFGNIPIQSFSGIPRFIKI